LPGRRRGLSLEKAIVTAAGHRCDWADSSEAMRRYHDEEWGVPSHDDIHLFEMLVLEGAQAGLSWSTILNKRVNYRRAFAGFDPVRVARFDDDAIAGLSDRLSRDLKQRGFSFVGSTIVYSFLQAVGVVDDHLVGCPSKRLSTAP
jgi:3-methyladenine DNA glycosylase Tag